MSTLHMSLLDKLTLDPSFAAGSAGGIRTLQGDDAIRAKLIQVLFTAPGERVHQPEFGCGLFKLLFEPQHEVLAPALQFTVGQALTRWMGHEIVVDAVHVSMGEAVQVEVVYTRRVDLQRQAVRISFK